VTHTDRSGDAGFIFQSKRTGAVLYGEEQGIDLDAGKYMVLCVHGRCVHVNSKRVGRYVCGHPEDLCPACQKQDFTERSLTNQEESE
jgi:hypothetical protein